MKQISNQYTFDHISSSMKKTFGMVRKGTEDAFAMELATIEGNLLRINRRNKIYNGRRALEAIKICLFIIDGYINGYEYDLSNYKTPENEPLVEAVLMAFDPYTNEDILEALGNEFGQNSLDNLRAFFTHPIQCLLRIEESIALWTKRDGSDGYFIFIEGFMGHMVPHDEKMNFTVMTHTTL